MNLVHTKIQMILLSVLTAQLVRNVHLQLVSIHNTNKTTEKGPLRLGPWVTFINIYGNIMTLWPTDPKSCRALWEAKLPVGILENSVLV